MKSDSMLPESSRISMTFGVTEVVEVPSGSGEMLSGGAANAELALSVAVAAKAAWRKRRRKIGMVSMVSPRALVQYGLHVAHGVARPSDAHRDSIESDARDLCVRLVHVLDPVADGSVRARGLGKRGFHAPGYVRVPRCLAKPMDHVLDPVARGIEAQVHRQGRIPREVRDGGIRADQIEFLLPVRVVELRTGRLVVVQERRVAVQPAARGLDSPVAARGRALPEGEVACDQHVSVDRAHEGDPGERHRHEHDQGDEENRATLAARSGTRRRFHDVLQIMLRNGITVSKTRYL